MGLGLQVNAAYLEPLERGIQVLLDVVAVVRQDFRANAYSTLEVAGQF